VAKNGRKYAFWVVRTGEFISVAQASGRFQPEPYLREALKVHFMISSGFFPAATATAVRI
jgi:hypothetical protein